jgi:hypothetical protein
MSFSQSHKKSVSQSVRTITHISQHAPGGAEVAFGVEVDDLACVVVVVVVVVVMVQCW